MRLCLRTVIPVRPAWRLRPQLRKSAANAKSGVFMICVDLQCGRNCGVLDFRAAPWSGLGGPIEPQQLELGQLAEEEDSACNRKQRGSQNSPDAAGNPSFHSIPSNNRVEVPEKEMLFPRPQCDGPAPLALQHHWTDLPSLALAPCTSEALGSWPRVDPGLDPFSRRSERC
jgi:hypothetical protein